MQIDIEVNDAEARRVINQGPADVRTAMRGGMEDATTYALAIIKRYPAPPSQSTYTRQHILEKSWSRHISGQGTDIRGLVGSSAAVAPYNRYVQDRERQARIHQGRWLTAQDLAEQEEPAVIRMFEDRLRAVGQ